MRALRRITNDNRYLLLVQAGLHIMVPAKKRLIVHSLVRRSDRYRKNQKDMDE